MEELEKLVSQGLRPGRGIAFAVSQNFEKIREARELGWAWREIAEALGHPGKSRRVIDAFYRISRKIDSGKLKVPGKDQQNNRKEGRKEEKKEIPGSDRTAPAVKVNLVEGKVSKDGACEAFRRLPSID